VLVAGSTPRDGVPIGVHRDAGRPAGRRLARDPSKVRKPGRYVLRLHRDRDDRIVGRGPRPLAGLPWAGSAAPCGPPRRELAPPLTTPTVVAAESPSDRR